MRKGNALKLMVILSAVLLNILPAARLASCQNDNADSVRPFTIHLSDDVLNELRERLDKTRFKLMLKKAHISLTTDVKSLNPMSPDWDRRLMPPGEE